MFKFQKPGYLILCIVGIILGIRLYTYYLEQKQADLVQKTEKQRIALEQAPLQHSTAIIAAITFTPKHTKTVYYPAGKKGVRSHSYDVQASYEVIFNINGLKEPVKLTEYNVANGEQYQKGDTVEINYKQIKSPFSSKEAVPIMDFKPILLR